MGNQQLAQSNYLEGSWKVIQTIANRQLIQNQRTHMQLQRHFSIIQFETEKQQLLNMKNFQWRKNIGPNVNIVKLYQYKILEQRFSRKQDQYIITQKILRFNQMSKLLSKPEGFLLIHNLISGIQILFNQFGTFNINIFCIGINCSGIGKIWLNQNFAKNKFQNENQIPHHTQNFDLVTVNNLVRLVKSRVYNQDFMPQFQFPYNMNFQQTKSYINYIRQQSPLFNIDKIYLNRDQFRRIYSELYNRINYQTVRSKNILNYEKSKNLHQQKNNKVIYTKNQQVNSINMNMPNTNDTSSNQSSRKKQQLPFVVEYNQEYQQNTKYPFYIQGRRTHINTDNNYQKAHNFNTSNNLNSGTIHGLVGQNYPNKNNKQIIYNNYYDKESNNIFRDRVEYVNRNDRDNRRTIYIMQPAIHIRQPNRIFNQSIQGRNILSNNKAKIMNKQQKRNISIQNRNISLQKNKYFRQNNSNIVVKKDGPYKIEKVKSNYKYKPINEKNLIDNNYEYNTNGKINKEISAQTCQNRQVAKDTPTNLYKGLGSVASASKFQSIPQSTSKFYNQSIPYEMVKSKYQVQQPETKKKQQLQNEQQPIGNYNNKISRKQKNQFGKNLSEMQNQVSQVSQDKNDLLIFKENKSKSYIHNVQMVSSMIINRDNTFGQGKKQNQQQFLDF